MPKIELIQGDCLEEMKGIPDGSVDMVLTDPPYGTIKGIKLGSWDEGTTDWDEIIDPAEMFNAVDRVLRMNGSLLLFAQEPFTSDLIKQKENGNIVFSYRLNWLKDIFANHLMCNKAPVNYIEDIVVFFKKYDTLNLHPLREYSKILFGFIGKTPRELFADLGCGGCDHFTRIESIQFNLCTEKTYKQLIEKYNIDGESWFITYQILCEVNRKFNRRFNRRFNLAPNKKYKSNVLEYKKDGVRFHNTQKPVALLEDLIKTYTNEGDTVLDFTMGSGTTGIACKNLNRDFIGIEKDAKYFKIAEERIRLASMPESQN